MPNGVMLIVCGLLAVGGLWFYARQVALISVPVPKIFGFPEIALALVLAALFVCNTLSSWGKETPITPQVLAQGIVMYVLLTIVVLSVLIVHDINPVRALGLRWSGWKRGLGFMLIALAACMPILLTAERVSFEFAGPGAKPQEILTFLVDHHDLRDRMLLLTLAVILSPITEELVFRGLMYGVLRQYTGRVAGMVITSAIFAFIHGHLPSLASLFLLAVALTVVYERTGSLWAPISMHATFNALNALVAINGPSSL